MNKTQSNFKREIAKSLYYEEKKAKRGKGIFSNNLFSLRFYGYNNNQESKYRPLPVRILLFIIKSICFIVGLAFILALILLVISLLFVILKTIITLK